MVNAIKPRHYKYNSLAPLERESDKYCSNIIRIYKKCDKHRSEFRKMIKSQIYVGFNCPVGEYLHAFIYFKSLRIWTQDSKLSGTKLRTWPNVK